MKITIPELSFVILIGPSGSGKSTFAKKHFLSTEVLSADHCRALVSDNENDLSVTKEAFEILHYIASKRLAAGKFTVVDATNVQKEARNPLIKLAREFHCLPVAIIFDFPERVCQDRNKNRTDRDFGKHVIRQQLSQMRRSMKGFKREGFRHIFKFSSENEIDAVAIERVPLWNDKRAEHGPFDIIGDVHGCCDELEELLDNLGYIVAVPSTEDDHFSAPLYSHPEGRKAVFLGDLVDRGPRILDTIKLVYNMVEAGEALCLPGNHDIKFMRKLRGWDLKIVHGLAESLAEIEAIPEALRTKISWAVHDFIDGLVSHYVLDDGRLVVAHAGLKAEMQGRGSGAVREFCLYGETTGETDEFGLPIRYNWAAEYRGNSTVVYGHTPVPESEWVNQTINIDTGCVFGGKLTALRYPEKELVSVNARKTYTEPVRPLRSVVDNSGLTSQQRLDDVLDLEDVTGKRIVETRYRSKVIVREENAMAALEIISRYAVNPKWLIYLPPTMSPSETASHEELLEHPAEAFVYYRNNGVKRVVCEEKHMGSRAIVIVCRDENVAVKRFGIIGDGIGKVYTRTGRPFFYHSDMETELLCHVKNSLDLVEFWSRFNTDWACLDCELMPWSAKAQELLKSQYAAVGAAGRQTLNKASQLLKVVLEKGYVDENGHTDQSGSSIDFDPKRLLERLSSRREMVDKYIASYRRYCWPVDSITDYRLAPFHLMATEGKLYTELDHVSQMELFDHICTSGSDVLMATAYKVVELEDTKSEKDAVEWWEKLTEDGGEGIVIKPFLFVTKGKRGIVQPALKCRGKEYLRIIYGPEYTAPEHLPRLRARSLRTKRSLAMREFTLGIEGLERFINREPLRRVHECVFAILAMESEPVDPRL
jgi:protein phosphatase